MCTRDRYCVVEHETLHCRLFLAHRYIPILWFDDQRVMDQTSAETLHEEFLSYVDVSLETAWNGLIASATLAVVGSILWMSFVLVKVKHDRRVWID